MSKKQKHGEIKLRVLELFFLNPEKRFRASEVFSYIKNEYGIKQRRGIYRHLETLKNNKLLTYDDKTSSYCLPKNFRERDYWDVLVRFLDLKDKNLRDYLEEIARLISKEAKDVVIRFNVEKDFERLFHVLENSSPKKLTEEIFLSRLSILLDYYTTLHQAHFFFTFSRDLLQILKSEKLSEKTKKEMLSLIYLTNKYYKKILENSDEPLKLLMSPPTLKPSKQLFSKALQHIRKEYENFTNFLKANFSKTELNELLESEKNLFIKDVEKFEEKFKKRSESLLVVKTLEKLLENPENELVDKIKDKTLNSKNGK